MQEKDSILLAHWSKRQGSWRSWTCWLLCTTSSEIRAQCMEGASRRGILGRHRSCDSIRLDRMQSSFKEYFQLIVFQKLWDWRLEKSYMKKHTCLLDHHQRSHYVTIGQELGSKVVQQPEGKVVQQPEGEVVRQAKFFQPTQPIPSPNCDRATWYHARRDSCSRWKKNDPFSRDQCEFFQRRTLFFRQIRDLISRKTWSVFKHVHLKTARVSMLSRLMIDQCDLVKTQLQYKTTLKCFMRSKRSTPTMRQFVRELRKTWTSKFQDYHFLLWSKRTVPAFENWFRKSRTTQIDTLFNKIYDKIKHLILSVQNQNKWFMKLETLNCVNCLRRDPTRSAQHACHIGTLASSIARAGTSYVKEERKIRNSSSTRWTSFQFPTTS